MSNLQQNEIQSETEQVKKEINLLQKRLKKYEKSQNEFQNGLMGVKRIPVKKRQRKDFSHTKRIQNIVRNILLNKIQQNKNNTN